MLLRRLCSRREPSTLYQYFPNKQALTTALYGRETERLVAAFVRIASELGLGDIFALTRGFIEETVRTFEENRALYRVLLEEVPRVDGLESTHAVDQVAIAQLRSVLELGRDRLATEHVDIAARLVVRAYRYNTIAVLREPLALEEREVFIDELTRMIVGYLIEPRR